MAEPPAWAIIRQLRQQKLNYYQNTLTEDAIWTNLSLTYDLFDFVSFLADFTLSDTLFSSLMSSFLFDIPLTEIVPINMNWRIELPTLDEFLEGVLIKLVPVTLSDLVPDLSFVLENPLELLTPEAREAIEETKLEKCIYGKSTYSNCYVDPAAVREFLRSTLFAFTKKWHDIKTARDMVAAAAKALGISEALVEDVFNRLSKITFAKYNCLTWDYGWWDVSYWCEEEERSEPVGVLTYIDYNLQPRKSEYESLFDAQAGCIWDESFWDMCYWGGDTPETVSPYITGDTRISQIQDALLSNFQTRFLATALAIANYQRPEERGYPFANERVEIYAQSRAFTIDIEATVRNIVQSLVPNIDPVTLRFYIDAALELYGLSTPHKWGLEMLRSMTKDEFKKYWLEKYTRMGLDPNILENIWNKITAKIEAYSDIRVQTRLEFIRRKLRSVR